MTHTTHVAEVRDWDVGADHPVRAALLAHVTTERGDHDDHPGRHAAPGRRCSACRWIEITILRTTDDTYLVRQVGRTRVPGETTRDRLDETVSPYEVVELLTLRRRDRLTNAVAPVMPACSARALAQAAARDEAVLDAYENRAVA